MSLRKSPKRSVTVTKSVRDKKISAPIPIKDEDGLPIRTPGSGVATSSLGNENDDTQVQLRNSTFTAPRFAPYKDGSSSQYSAEPLPQSQRSGISTQEPLPEVEHQHTNTSQVLRQGSAASRRSVSMRGKPQRKKSSFRTVVGRIFGKKQKGSSISSPISSSNGPPDSARAGQHRSVPPPLNKSPKGSLYQKRSNSMPINELDRALHSNAVGGDQFTMYNSDNATTGGLSDIDGQSRPRRATTPSRLYTPNRTPGYVGWAGLSPRPATARGSRVTPDIVDPETIGYAVTSGSNPHRRSRSLSELQNAALKQGGVVRRRSDEIKYWRESYEPGPLSPLSSNKPDAEDNLIGDNIETPQDEGQVLTPPQPFNFGPLGEMAGMKITQAASLETRVSKLEAKILEMERVVSINSKLPTKASHILDDPVRRRSDNDYSSFQTGLRTESSDFSLLKMKPFVELRPDTADVSPCNTRPASKSTDELYETSFQGHPYLHTTAQNLPQIVAPRPLSTSTTIRGHSSSSPTVPLLPKDGVITAERYTALVNMILAEQAARRHLENMVEDLQTQIRAMRSPGSTTFPQPSPTMRLQDRDFTDFEQDIVLNDDEANYQHNEIFQAQSEPKPGFTGEEFGMHLRTGSQEEREAVRTMSLGEITLGKRLQRV